MLSNFGTLHEIPQYYTYFLINARKKIFTTLLSNIGTKE